MPRYAFTIDAGTLGPRTETQELENDEVAVHVARRMFGPAHRSIRVGRADGEDVRWLGAWDSAERTIRWTEQP